MAWNADVPELTLVHLLYGTTGPVSAYRVIRGEYHRPEDFRSAYELRHPPPRRIQNDSAAIWMAVSMLSTLDAAISRARLFPRLGSYVAEVELRPGNGFVIAETSEPGHYSVWGDPFKLDAGVTAVYPVD